MTHALVTGATGFIGHHLVKRLSEQGHQVSCLVRERSNRSGLQPFDPKFCFGDVTDLPSLHRAMQGIDVVYHLAGLTKGLRAGDLMRVNELGTRNVARACAEVSTSPVLVIASSLAAAGPAPADRPRNESDPPTPVSKYGRSKLAGELAAREFLDRVRTTIVRPPIVFGEGDKDGFNLFQGIARFGVHLVPGFRDYQFSAIHAVDLATALSAAAERGRRLQPEDATAGTYFAADPQTFSYAEFGRMIGRGLGRPRAWVVRMPGPMLWSVSAVNEAVAQVRRRPHIVNLDKAREAVAGSWACSPAMLGQDTGFRCARPLAERIQQTADWYENQGWLRRRRPRR